MYCKTVIERAMWLLYILWRQGSHTFPCPSSPERCNIVPSLTRMATGSTHPMLKIFSVLESWVWSETGVDLWSLQSHKLHSKEAHVTSGPTEYHSYWVFRRVQYMWYSQGEYWEWLGTQLLRIIPGQWREGWFFLDHILDDLEVESS